MNTVFIDWESEQSVSNIATASYYPEAAVLIAI